MYLRHFPEFIIPLVKFAYNGTETISFLGPQVQAIIPSEIKGTESLGAFKFAINQSIAREDCANAIKLELDLIKAWNC